MSIILDEIIKNSDPVYRNFQKKLVPTVDEGTVLGLRSPDASRIAKKYVGTREAQEFLQELPHKYYDENIVHAFILGNLRCSTEELLGRLEAFLPYVDNWAVCDGLCAHLKNLFKKPEDVYEFVLDCIKKEEEYTVRFGIVCLLDYYITPKYIDRVLEICTTVAREEYYIKMAVAWLVSFCLIKEYEKSVTMIEKHLLPKWIHDKSIQKACESYQVSREKKEYLKSLRIK